MFARSQMCMFYLNKNTCCRWRRIGHMVFLYFYFVFTLHRNIAFILMEHSWTLWKCSNWFSTRRMSISVTDPSDKITFRSISNSIRILLIQPFLPALRPTTCVFHSLIIHCGCIKHCCVIALRDIKMHLSYCTILHSQLSCLTCLL